MLVHKCKLNTEHYTEILDMFNLLKGNWDSAKEYGPIFENRNTKNIAAVVFYVIHTADFNRGFCKGIGYPPQIFGWCFPNLQPKYCSEIERMQFLIGVNLLTIY